MDGAPTAIEILRSRSAECHLKIEAITADFEKGEYEIEPAHWDLIVICYYLQKNLFEPAKLRGVMPWRNPDLPSFTLRNLAKKQRLIACALASWNNISQAGKFFIAVKERQTIRPTAAP